MEFFEFVIALVAVGGGFVTVWIFLLSQRKEKKMNAAGSQSAQYDTRELSAIAQSLKERIDTLESILDAEVPDWREQNEHSSR